MGQMRTKNSLRLLICGVAILGMLAVAMMSGGRALAEPDRPYIAAALAKRLAERGTADMVVEFRNMPDLSPALSMDWEARGEYVVRALKLANQRAHAGAIRYLAARKLRHRAFLVGNLLYVYGGDRDAATTLAALPEVAAVRAPITIHLPPLEVNEGPVVHGTTAWGLNDSNAPAFWSTFNTQGAGIVVANIDTGVQYNHPALVSSFNCASPTDTKCWRDPSNICGTAGACDNSGHGTHTMGTMIAADDASLPYVAGMAPKAKWIACKGCESNSCSEAALNTCADWILSPGGSAANRPHIVNNSWGGFGNDAWYRNKVEAWQAAGIFPAFSAGNSGPSCRTLGSPGDYQQSFATAAHDATRAIAWFSSRGPSAYGYTPYTKPNISAPGVNILSTVPGNGWAAYSGTSMASPHTAGAVALLWSCNPALKGNISQTIELLQRNADPAQSAGSCGGPPNGEGNYTFGYGYLNILATGLAACNGVTTPTVSVKEIVPLSTCRTQVASATTTIVDQGYQPVGGAVVTGSWTRPNGAKVTVTATTASNGQARVLLRTFGSGVYRFCVTGVNKSGSVYDAAANVETCDQITHRCN